METRLKEVLAIANNKGGVGKTTTAQFLAAALVRMDKNLRVLVIDLDPQMHLSIMYGWNESDDFFTTPTIYTAMRRGVGLPVYRTTRDGVFLVPGDVELEYAGTFLTAQPSSNKVLQKCFGLPIDDHTDLLCPKGEAVQPSICSWQACEKEGLTTVIKSFDYVLIDCAPALGVVTLNSIAVDLNAIQEDCGIPTSLLIPVQMGGFSIKGLGKMIVKMREIQSDQNPHLVLRGLLCTMVDSRTSIANHSIGYLRRVYGENVCATTIRRCVKTDEAQTMRKDIYAYKPGLWSAVANDYRALAKELFGNQQK